MVDLCHRSLMERNRNLLSEVLEIEEAVDGLKRAIENYLDRIPAEALSEREESRLHLLQHVTGDIERVGDQAVNIAQRALLLFKADHVLSEPAQRDLNDLFLKTGALYHRAVAALREEDVELAREALELEQDVDRLEHAYKASHLDRLEQGQCDSTAGVLYVEILHNLERMGDHAVNIAGDVLHVF
jgi:phosphate:Na+ symporter